MTQEVLKLALEALENSQNFVEASANAKLKTGWGEQLDKADKAITAIKEALAKEKTLQALHDENERLGLYKDAYAEQEQEPVGKLQEPAAERAWFTIAELNAWADKKLSENPHWVMPKDEPERDDPPPQRTEQEPVAWRTFDGEGGYDYRSYEDNESYADEWDKRNPNHKGWVDKLYTTPPPCPTCEALARTVMMDQTGRDA